MKSNRWFALGLLAAGALYASHLAAAKRKPADPTPVERFVKEASHPVAPDPSVQSPGSLWSPSAQFADMGRDPKASQVNDVVTIVVSERASAVATGTTKTQRKSNANSSIGSLAGPLKAAGALANLATVGSNAELQGDGTTTRSTTLTTTLTARVTGVLPNGYLVLEGTRDIDVNSERQRVTVRGVARPADISPDNSLRSERLAEVEVRLNGKGVVGDVNRRPFILYRILLGLLPF